MQLTNNYHVSINRKGEVWTNITGQWELIETEPQRTAVIDVYRLFRRKHVRENDKIKALHEVKTLLANANGQTMSEDDELAKQAKLLEQKQTIIDGLQKLMNFFTEFDFSPNFRFCNTFARLCYSENYKSAKAYVSNYFALTDNGYKSSVDEKMNSQEFKEIVSLFSNIQTTKVINSRFKLYYGSQGTGKTTEAMEEALNNCTVCHSAMLPSDLMEDFSFEDGKATFKPSQLCKAMTEGKKIVLDEINLLPFESLRFLQSILDGKASFVYKGQTIEIKPGFQIIGTMNLQVNGMTYALPEPLVDRAAELKQFELTADKLLGAII